MRNLLKETLHVLTKNNLSEKDVDWVGSADGKLAMTWEEFTQVADLEYDEGYRNAEVAEDLIVVCGNLCLERREYAGSEAWVVKRKPKLRKKVPGSIRKVTLGKDDLSLALRTLMDLNPEE